MLSLGCRGWQRAPRGESDALPGRRTQPFSQGGGEDTQGEWAWSLSKLGSQTPLPLLAGMQTGPKGRRAGDEGKKKEEEMRGEEIKEEEGVGGGESKGGESKCLSEGSRQTQTRRGGQDQTNGSTLTAWRAPEGGQIGKQTGH